MKEYTAIVTLMTGDVMHAEYLRGDAETLTAKIHALEHGHTILSVSFHDTYEHTPEITVRDSEDSHYHR